MHASVFMCCGAAVCDYAWLMFACCLKCHGRFTATSVICSAGSSVGGGDDGKVRRLNPNWCPLTSVVTTAQLCALTAWRAAELPAPSVIMWDTLNIPSVAQVQLLDLHPLKVAAHCPIGVGGTYLLSTSAEWGLTCFIDGCMDKLV